MINSTISYKCFRYSSDLLNIPLIVWENKSPSASLDGSILRACIELHTAHIKSVEALKNDLLRR